MIRWVVSLLAAVSLSVIWGINYLAPQGKNDMRELNIQVPFVFSEKIDPRAVYTVGDQVVSEHVFAFHTSSSIKKSTVELFSQVTIDRKNNLVQIKLLRDVIDNLGNKLSLEDVCACVKSSFSGTQHTRYNSLVQSISCSEGVIEIKMISIPINLEYWLRSTDFAIFSPNKLPLTNSSERSSTGPYSVVSMTPTKVELKANPFFPLDLRANRIEKVNLNSYQPGDLESLLALDELHLAYIYGYSVNQEIISKFKKRDFNIQIYPNEWLMYLGFQKNLDFETRNAIGAKIDSLRTTFQEKIVFGNAAFSTVPSERAYGLSEDEYLRNIVPLPHKAPKIKLRFATLDEWSKIPLFDFIIKELQKDFNIELKLFERKDLLSVYSPNESDFYLTPMGISAADPLGNYSFFLTYEELFKNAFSQSDLIRLYQEKDFQKFSGLVKEIELKLLRQRILVPLGHFPGIVIESPRLIRDEKKSWDWGIQAWAYKIN